MRITRTLMISLLFASACDEGGPAHDEQRLGEALISYYVALNLSTEEECLCFYDVLGYASEAQCNAAELMPALTATRQQCIEEQAAGFGAWADAVECIAAAELTASGCYSAAPCTDQAFEACDAQYVAAEAACPDPCAGLTGTPLNTCRSQLGTLIARVNAC